MFREISVELNGWNVSNTSLLYPYSAYLKTPLNYSKTTQDTRLLSKTWGKDSTKNMGVTEVAGAIAGLNIRAVTFTTSTVVELAGRLYLDVFLQDCLIFPGIDLHINLIPATDKVVCKSAAPAACVAQ